MHRRKIAKSLLNLVVCFIIGSIIYFQVSKDERVRVQLFKSLAAAVERRSGGSLETSLRLAEVTDFGWEKVYIFRPYTTPKQIDEALGFTWTEAKKTDIERDDSFNLLVFTTGSQVVQYVTFPRHLGQFDSCTDQAAWSAYGWEEAVFRVEERKENGQAFPMVCREKQ